MLNGSKRGRKHESGKNKLRRMLFANAILAGRNQTEAALIAGATEKTARSQGSTWRKDPFVKQIIDDSIKAANITSQEVIAGLSLIANANMQDVEDVLRFGIQAVPRHVAAAITELTVDHTGGAGDGKRMKVLRTKVKLGSKLEALAILAKHFGLAKETLEITASEDIIAALAAGRERVAKLRGGSPTS